MDLLLGVAVPLLGYGLFAILFSGSHVNQEVPIGISFIAMGLCTYLISGWQIRKIERQNESH